jgi:hypothetical protein
MAEQTADIWSQVAPYDRWLESQKIPVHEGYYVEDLRTLKLGCWESRGCDGAFLKLAGQEGVTQAYVTEIPPGDTLPPFRIGLDEAIYVVQGRGLTTIWAEGRPKKTFEWQKHSLFMIPSNYHYQLGNTQGNSAVRLLHFSYLPLAMSIYPSGDFFLNSSYVDSSLLYGEGGGGFYSEAKVLTQQGSERRPGMWNVWYGNFFPDMRAWDQLQPFKGRGAGGHVVWIGFPSSTIYSHMSVFPAQTYKKAHRHGPGVVIVIPAGEGYSVMWPEGKEKLVVPWHEASVFVPPNRWFHQHFNVGSSSARYLALHAPRFLRGFSERVEDQRRDQIEYPEEEPWIRQRFESELGKRGFKSLMPEQAYRDRSFEWSY